MQSLQVRMNFQSRSLVEKLGLAADSTAKATASRSNSLKNLSLIPFRALRRFVNSFLKTLLSFCFAPSKSDQFHLTATWASRERSYSLVVFAPFSGDHTLFRERENETVC